MLLRKIVMIIKFARYLLLASLIAFSNKIIAGNAIPNDPLYNDQWALHGPYSIDVERAWALTTGSSNVIVGVIDSGITSHSEFAGRVLPGYDFIQNPGAQMCPNDGNGRDSDASDPGDAAFHHKDNYLAPGTLSRPSSWHGTRVAGIIAAARNNGSYMAGINGNARILPVRVDGCGSQRQDLIDGMRWAAGLPVSGVPNNPNPAHVLNVSLHIYETDGYCKSDMQSAINEILAKNITIVVTAGNADSYLAAPSEGKYMTPANCAGVITVGATNAGGFGAHRYDANGKLEYSIPSSFVKISAPGEWILSTSNTGLTSPIQESYGIADGTSFAAPQVTGVISLMLSVNPKLTPAEILQILQKTAKPFNTNPDPVYPPYQCNTSICGAGIVNATGAVNAVVEKAAKEGTLPAPIRANYARQRAIKVINILISE